MGNLIRLSNDRDVTLAGGGTALVLRSQGVLLSSRIDTQVYPLDFPGSNEEPGHREISDSGVGDEHIEGNIKDTTTGISTVRYIFRNVYGSIPDNQGGQQLAFNLITNAQKQRAREAFELISQNAGVQFVETIDESDTTAIIVATGDERAIPRPFAELPTSRGAIDLRVGFTDVADGPSVDSRLSIILDNSVNWNDQYGLSDEANRQSWFRSVFDGIERLCETIDLLKERYLRKIPIYVLPTLVDNRTRLARKFLRMIWERFPDDVLPVMVHQTVRR